MSIRTPRRLTTPLAIAAGLALALSACSGGGGSSKAGEPQGEDPTSDYTPGPLEKMWTEAYGEFNPDQANAQQARMEQLVAECMSEQGWEYTPVDSSQMDPGISYPNESADPDEPQWGTEEYAKLRGYGITTWDTDSGSATSEPMPEPIDEPSAPTDPNQVYVESLSETAQKEYWEALNGPQPTEEEMTSGEWEYDPENAGCYGEASAEVYSAANIWEDEKYKGLVDEMNLIYTQIENDPKITEAKAAWSACMADAGHPGLADTNAAQEQLYTALNAYWEKGEEPPADVLAALREREIALATADFQCAKKADVNKVQVEVQHRVEQEFIDKHKAELEELMAAQKAQEDAARG